jgi:hypothetical protein
LFALPSVSLRFFPGTYGSSAGSWRRSRQLLGHLLVLELQHASPTQLGFVYRSMHMEKAKLEYIYRK